MTLNQMLLLAAVALVASAVGFVLGSRIGQRRLIRRVGDDAQEWLDQRSAS